VSQRVLLMSLLSLFAAAETLPEGMLIVCVESGSNLPDLDVGEAYTSPGADAYVAVFVGDMLQFRTNFKPGSSHPVWNECFTASGGAKYSANTPISFTVVDVDSTSEDDVIGVACMEAGTKQRSLLLTGPASADASDRGILKVRTYLFVEASQSLLQFETRRSEAVTPILGHGAVTATVSCPVGHELTACQCASSGTKPGCLYARVDFNPVTGRPTCHASSNEPKEPPYLPPCGSGAANEYPGVTCRSPNWTPPHQGWVAAVARCATLSYGTAWAQSEPSRVSIADATEVRCSTGTMTGCAMATAAGLGARFEDGDSDGRTECVGYSDGEHAAVAQALCTSSPDTSGGSRFITQPVLAETPLATIATDQHTIVQCPEPFAVAGCSCYSELANCRGASFDAIQVPSTAMSPHHAVSVCNVSHAVPSRYRITGVEAHAICVWHGPANALIEGGASTCVGTRESVADKAWLPPGWRLTLDVSNDAGNRDRSNRKSHQEGFSSGLVNGMLIMFLSCAIFGLFGALVVLSARKRRMRNMGGAPTMLPARHVVGDVLSTSSSSGIAIVHPHAIPERAGSAYVAPVPTPITSTPAQVPAASLVVQQAASVPLIASDSAVESSRI